MTTQLLALLAITVLLVLVDRYTPLLKPVRTVVGTLIAPIYWISDTPSQVGDWFGENWVSRDELQEENAALKAELLIYKRKLQRMATLAAENVRMRELLGSAERVERDVLVGELIGVSPDPYTHKVIVNKGTKDGAALGQSVLDAEGLVGQVVAVTAVTSEVLLITDKTHAIPVQVNRNGVRAIVEGSGELLRLRLRHLSPTTDIRPGDLLVSSGLGGRFPVGYPVAEVSSVVIDPGQAFAEVEAIPKAHLNRSRHLLLVLEPELQERPGLKAQSDSKTETSNPKSGEG